MLRLHIAGCQSDSQPLLSDRFSCRVFEQQTERRVQDRFKSTFKSIKTCKTLRETTAAVTRALKKVHLLRYTNDHEGLFDLHTVLKSSARFLST